MGIIGTRSVSRELEEHERRLAELEENGGGGGGIVAVNEPEPGQVLSANEDGEFEWVTPEAGGGIDVPRVAVMHINGGNGEIRSSFVNVGEEAELFAERIDIGVYKIVVNPPFPEPVPGALAPPFVSVLPIGHAEGEPEEEVWTAVIPVVDDNSGLTGNGTTLVKLHKADGTPVDSDFYYTILGPAA